VIIALSLIAGLTSMIICAREREHVPELTDAESLQKDLRIAALAALAFQNDQGRRPYSLKELRALQYEHYLPREFALKGVTYFRNDGGAHG
jgi:transposase InsO family protein